MEQNNEHLKQQPVLATGNSTGNVPDEITRCYCCYPRLQRGAGDRESRVESLPAGGNGDCSR